MLTGKILEFPSCCMACIFHDISETEKETFDKYEYYKNNDYIFISNKIDLENLMGNNTICYATMPINSILLIDLLTSLGFIPVDMNQNVNTGNNILLMKYVKEWNS